MRVCVVCVLRVCVRVCTGLSMTNASTRLLRVGKDTHSTCIAVSIFSSLYIYMNGTYISVHQLAEPVFAQLQALLCLAQLQAQHLHLHQQDCGSAAAAATAGMRRVWHPMLHVSSNTSCDHVTCVSLLSICVTPRDFTSPTSRRGTL